MSYSQIGGINLLNSTVVGNQHAPRTTRLVNGTYVVTWIDSSGQNGDTSGLGITAQRFAANGSKIGIEFQVNTQTEGQQFAPQISALSGGGFVITWSDSSGLAPDGKFLSPFGHVTHGQLFDVDGTKVGGEFLSGPITSFPSPNALVGLADGGYLIVTSSSNSGAFVLSKYDATGALQSSSEPLVPSFGAYEQPSVTALATGGYVIAWRMNSSDPGGIYDVAAQIFDVTGGKVGSQLILSTQISGVQFEPAIISLANGNFVASWYNESGPSGAGLEGGTIGQVFSANGLRIGAEFAVNSNANGNQFGKDLVALPDGGFVVAYVQATVDTFSLYSIQTQVYNALGVAQGQPYIVESGTRHAVQGLTIAALAGGQFVVSWGDDDGTQTDVRSVTFSPDPYERFITGTSAADTLTGGMLDDTINGLAGNDTLLGGAGNDILNGGLGNDILNGGTGNDTATYADSVRGVEVCLSFAGVQNTVGAGKDSLISIENLIGSVYSDTLSGNAAANRIEGGLGADYLAGAAGNDILFGGAGKDTLDGGTGDDVLTGGAGADTLIGGAGADTFVLDSLTSSADSEKITDFTHGLDHIALAQSAFTALVSSVPGQLDASAFLIGKRATNSDQHIIYDRDTGALFYDSDGVGGEAQVQIATLSKKTKLSLQDIILLGETVTANWSVSTTSVGGMRQSLIENPALGLSLSTQSAILTSSADRHMAVMIQDMASFGLKSSESDLSPRGNDSNVLHDFFA
jgi:Ca2+-binding RTX toxin-like protein